MGRESRGGGTPMRWKSLKATWLTIWPTVILALITLSGCHPPGHH
jgi:hypothetical protein